MTAIVGRVAIMIRNAWIGAFRPMSKAGSVYTMAETEWMEL
jgi:hypothetical protein